MVILFGILLTFTSLFFLQVYAEVPILETMSNNEGNMTTVEGIVTTKDTTTNTITLVTQDNNQTVYRIPKNKSLFSSSSWEEITVGEHYSVKVKKEHIIANKNSNAFSTAQPNHSTTGTKTGIVVGKEQNTANYLIVEYTSTTTDTVKINVSEEEFNQYIIGNQYTTNY